MPELPDVEIFRKRIEDHAKGKTIEKISPAKNRVLKTPAKKIAGLKNNRIQSARREGKYCLLDMGDPGWLVLHFGMTGSVRPYAKGDKAPEYTVLSFQFQDQTDNLAVISKRKLGKIDLTGSPETFRKENEIGKDALQCSEEEFLEIMKNKRGSIKSAFLDQSTLSGIGNIYGDEILFHARIHPKKQISGMDEKQLGELYQTLQEVLKTAIDAGADPDKLPEDYLIPHRDKGEKCPSCKGKVKKIKVSGRSGYYCPECQKK